MTQLVHAIVMRRFAVSAERVFDACLDPAWVGGWILEPDVHDQRVVRIALDAHVGGRFSFVVNRSGAEIEHLGEYREIDRPGLLVFAWAVRERRSDTSRVIIEITSCDQGCELKLTHVMGAHWSSCVDLAAGAWSRKLDALESAIAEEEAAART